MPAQAIKKAKAHAPARFFNFTSAHAAHDHAGHVRHHPQAPHGEAVAVEGPQAHRVGLEVGPGGPGRVDGHQHQRDGTQQGVEGHAPFQTRHGGDAAHHFGSGGVTQKAEPEGGEVNGFDGSRPLLAPDAERVADESGSHGQHSKRERHAPILPTGK